MSESVNKLFTGPWTDQDWKNRCVVLSVDFESFVSGDPISVARNPRKAKTAYMSQLEKSFERTWDIRSREPAPGIRVLGRFSEKDTFIALHWDLRKNLDEYGSPAWNAAISHCKHNWRRLLHPYEPVGDNQKVSEANLHDYISNNTFLVGNQ